jgi:hypothetical protein
VTALRHTQCHKPFRLELKAERHAEGSGSIQAVLRDFNTSAESSELIESVFRTVTERQLAGKLHLA